MDTELSVMLPDADEEMQPVQPQSHGEWDLFWILLSFDGRITRSQFWVGLGVGFLLVCIAGMGVLLILDDYVNGIGSGDPWAPDLAGHLVAPLVDWIVVAIAAKRFHDRNKSGLWSLVLLVRFFFIGWLWVPVLIVNLWVLVECGFMPSTPGKNQYDSKPTRGFGILVLALILALFVADGILAPWFMS